jgi:hypothetical protein
MTNINLAINFKNGNLFFLSNFIKKYEGAIITKMLLYVAPTIPSITKILLKNIVKIRIEK